MSIKTNIEEILKDHPELIDPELENELLVLYWKRYDSYINEGGYNKPRYRTRLSSFYRALTTVRGEYRVKQASLKEIV